jgi:hypothetical protein
MAIVSFLLLAAAGWFYAAANYQDRGYWWADRTCDNFPSLCDSPALVVAGAGIAIALYVGIKFFKDS